MTNREALRRAEQLGLSAWVVKASVVGEESSEVEIKRVGFASIDLPLGEGETWEEAHARAAKLIFSV
jgi:hypothetical protein